jgi:aminopeptidase N
MSEPTDAHYWMPCMDQPNDKALSEISIIVPNGIETASNGDLISKEAYTATSTIWHWKNDTPIATYLMVADASNFIHWSQTHERSKMPGDTVHLDYYAWPADYYQDSIKDGSTYNAQYFLSRNTSQIMTWFEARYGGFPFEKYGQVPVQPFIWGGMEHQTCTSINRGWLRGADEGIAHEMSHQWFGDKTTCETFKDIWLNEGFATFSEAVWAESWGGNEWYENIIYEKAADYFYGPDPHNIPIYDPPADNIFNGALTYAKGGLVLHMLRRMLNNDTMFFGALRDYSNAFAYTTANTLQLRDFLGTRLNMDLTEYFDQWIFGRLHPEYQVTWAQNINNRFFLRINQVQSTSIRDHFTMPVKFFAYHGNTIDTLTFTNNSRTQGFQQMLSYAIDSLVFDDDALILSTHTVKKNPALAVGFENTTPSVFDVYIIDGGKLLCKIHETKFMNATIELYNSVGVKIYDKEIQTGETSATIHLRNLASGIYFARYMNGSENFVRSINYVR